jgi:hypothetical protein
VTTLPIFVFLVNRKGPTLLTTTITTTTTIVTTTALATTITLAVFNVLPCGTNVRLSSQMKKRNLLQQQQQQQQQQQHLKEYRFTFALKNKHSDYIS